MKVHFVTPTKLSLLDITSMGDSIKKDDTQSIGMFDSGLKYAIALLLRDNVGIHIDVIGNTEKRDNYDEPYTVTYTFGTYVESDHKRNKELIKVIEDITYQGGSPMNQFNMQEPSSNPDPVEHKTGFAKALGHTWSLWMSMRELYSNMLDEGGYYTEENVEVEEGTVITLTFDDSNEFSEVWTNRHLYVNEKEPLHKISNRVEVLENEEGWLRIYKQNILVYEDKDKPSRYAFNIKFGKIDERRILSDVWSVSNTIAEEILNSKNEEFLREIITADFDLEEGEFLSSVSIYYTAPDLIHDIAAEVYQEHGQVQSYPWLLQKVKARKDCKIGGKVITTVEDSLWSYSKEVTVESRPISDVPLIPDECFTPLQIEINKFYNFELDVEYKKAKLKGSKVVADKYEKCLIIDEEFSVENDMAELVVEYLDLTQEGNVITNLSNYILNLIKK